MDYTFTFLESIRTQLADHFAAGNGKEMAGYVFAGVSRTEHETRFIGRQFRPVKPEHIIRHGPLHISIRSDSYCPALQHADQTKHSFWFIHSHPRGYPEFSPQDDCEEPKLFSTAYARIGGDALHGSIVFPEGAAPVGRIWRRDDTSVPLKRIRVIGSRFQFHDLIIDSSPIPDFFDRQVRAFGPDIQRRLASLHVIIVGGGGTGSAVAEQLIRLGVGKLTIIDPQCFEGSNVNRVYGSSVKDEGMPKVEILRRLAAHISLGTVVEVIPDSIYRKPIAERLREGDVIFGCTDEHAARSILGEVALHYAIPVIDVGVRIHSENQIIQSISGRTTVLYPGASCLYCRGRIDPRRVAFDMTSFFNPAEAAERRREGYAPELLENNPAVIPFTTTVAAGAVSELIHRLTGFMGLNRRTTEVIYRFDQNDLGRNSLPPQAGCTCADHAQLGRGDTKLFLGMMWP
jgi:molybdopterin/thiamine biosynthesis adenylyltransferase